MRRRIGEIAVPTRYFEEASSVGFQRSVVYGLSTLRPDHVHTRGGCMVLEFPGKYVVEHARPPLPPTDRRRTTPPKPTARRLRPSRA